MFLQSKSSYHEIDTDDDNSEECYRKSGIIFVKCDDMFCDFWKTDDSDSFHERYPSHECDYTSPVKRPDIVHENTRYTYREWRIPSDEYDTWFTHHWLHIPQYHLSSHKKKNSEDQKRKSPKLCQKHRSVHRKKLGSKRRKIILFFCELEISGTVKIGDNLNLE